MEAAIAWGFNKLIPVRVAELGPENIPDPFRAFQADDVADIDRVLRALAAKDVIPQETGARKNLSKEDIMAALGRIDEALPGRLEAFLHKCREEHFRIDIKRSMMVKASIANFGEVNFATIYQDGTFQTNYISESSERIGNPIIATNYLDGVAKLIPDATVRREGNSWTWRVEVFGALPKIAQAIARGDEWIALMKEARGQFVRTAVESRAD
jgi:hypothetical protein